MWLLCGSQDAAGQHNTYAPHLLNMHPLSKRVNSPKKSLQFKLMMNVIAGFGLCIQYGLPYLVL